MGIKFYVRPSDTRTLLTAPEQTPASIGNCFTNITIWKKITTFTAKELTTYLTAPSDISTENALMTDTIEEALHVLKINMFGRDHARQNML